MSESAETTSVREKISRLEYARDVWRSKVDMFAKSASDARFREYKVLEREKALIAALEKIVARSNNGALGTSKVDDMRRLAADAIAANEVRQAKDSEEPPPPVAMPTIET